MFEKKNYLAIVFGKLLIFAYTVFLLLPLYIIAVSAFKTREEIYINPIGFPVKPVFTNFIDAVIQGKILQYGMNSVIVSGVSIVLITIVDVLCAYGIYKIYSKKIGIMFYSIIMFGMMVPSVGYVSTILLYRSMHLYNTLWALIVSNVAGSLPFAMFLLVGFLRGAPKELEEASIIDGCSGIKSLIHILIPVIMPAIITVVIFNLISTWNNLFGALLLNRKERYFTIPVGLLNFRGQRSTDYQLLFAAVFIVSLPLLVIYFIFQKNFVESLSGGVKG